MKIALASDHAGFEEKQRLKVLIIELGHTVIDLGPNSLDSVDYPDYARAIAEHISNGFADRGVLVCGSGTGMAIAANKFRGIRAAVAWNQETARLSREHNDANVLAIGSRTTPKGTIPDVVRAWFDADFEGGRHALRVAKIQEIERSELSKQET